MGDNQSRTRDVAGGDVVDQWSTTSGVTVFEITVETLASPGCSVAVDVARQNDGGAVDVSTLVEVSPDDLLPSGPHRTVVAGVLGGSVVLRAVPLSDTDPGSCHVSYTFKWAG